MSTVKCLIITSYRTKPAGTYEDSPDHQIAEEAIELREVVRLIDPGEVLFLDVRLLPRQQHEEKEPAHHSNVQVLLNELILLNLLGYGTQQVNLVIS